MKGISYLKSVHITSSVTTSEKKTLNSLSIKLAVEVTFNGKQTFVKKNTCMCEETKNTSYESQQPVP